MARTRSNGASTTLARPRLELLEARLAPAANLTHHVLQVRQSDPNATYHTIQSAVDAAGPGDEVRVYGGTYREAVTVTKAGLTIDSAPGATVVIQAPDGATDGVTVSGTADSPLRGFTLAGVTVRDFPGDGVRLTAVTGFTLSNVTSINNSDYGLYPLLSAHGTVEGCVASGSNDSGIYVGQSSDVAVRGNRSFDNVNGIEIENSSGCSASGNVAYNNTVGILLDLLPAALVAEPGFTPVESSTNNVIEGNLVFGNNRPNTAASGDIAAVTPPGTGIAVVGGDHNVIRSNLVFGNAFSGIAVISGNDLLSQLPPGTPGYSPGVSPDPNYTKVTGNVVVANGFAPPQAGQPHPADLVWTRTGKHDHWSKNVFGTSTPGQLP
jgi:parallel beta-helix repeat protein